MKKQILRRAVLAAAISTASSGTMAAGFYLQETNPSGLGRAFAAENTIGDNAAILARNPAGSALFDRISLSAGVTYVNPEIDAAGDVTFAVVGTNPVTGEPVPLAQLGPFRDTANDYATDAFVPNFALAVPFDDCWSFGLAMFTDYGLETDFNPDWLVTHIADKTELLTVNIAPSVAYDFNDQFSIGLAVNFMYADATLKTKVPRNLSQQTGLFLPNGSAIPELSILDLEGDDWDVGWTLGALWHINDRTRFGISYHSELDPELDGDVSSDALPNNLGGIGLNNESANLTLDLPDTLELGFYHRFNSQWGLALGAMWTDWDDFERLEGFIPGQRFGIDPEPYNPLLIKEENFESGMRYSIAGEYYPCEEVTWRIGYAYDEGAARDGLNNAETAEFGLPITWRTLSIPDTDRQWVTFGGTYKFDDQLSIDGGFAYLWGDDETIQEGSIIPTDTLVGPGTALVTYFDGETTNIEAWLAGVSINYNF
ncbi:OmpP1/FadL family transporter [Microbulbifer yueqingensis]|uniref:Long-chain fatty acid transport protein n=1 Tax=Microbulbifer yueqingensis TaxID=658219 RepID=A0A1G9E0L3_9GAMM|nr:outer membrane protein transport protein [Microbulbifer yueqingensis]SDK69649.1 long-chain fatty acid transport protein [Microbulbifer yueqingensis]